MITRIKDCREGTMKPYCVKPQTAIMSGCYPHLSSYFLLVSLEQFELVGLSP